MTEKRTVGVAVVGAGAWGKNHVRNFASIPESNLLYVCDMHEPHRRRAAEMAPDAEATGDLAKVLADERVEAVVVATPPRVHGEVARKAVEAGKDVLVEKPITLDLAEARALVEAANERKRVLMVGHLLKYHSGVRKMRALVDAGELGRVHYLYSHRVNLGQVRSDENALWSLAPHDLSIALYLLPGARPVAAACQGGSYLQEGIEDVCFGEIFFDGGEVAAVHVSWLDPHKIRRFTVVGSKKMATFDDMEPAEKLRVYDKGAEIPDADAPGPYSGAVTLRNGDVRVPSVKLAEPLRAECEHFLDCVRERALPETPGEEGVAVLEILTAMGRSLETGGGRVEIGG